MYNEKDFIVIEIPEIITYITSHIPIRERDLVELLIQACDAVLSNSVDYNKGFVCDNLRYCRESVHNVQKSNSAFIHVCSLLKETIEKNSIQGIYDTDENESLSPFRFHMLFIDKLILKRLLANKKTHTHRTCSTETLIFV